MPRWRLVVVLALASCRVNTPDLDDYEFACDGGGCALDAGLLAHLPLDNVAGGETPDISGNRTASCASTRCPTMVAGKIGGALAFDGVNDAMVIAAGSTLDPTSGTLSLWIYIPVPPVGTFMTIAGKTFGPGFDNSYQLYLDDAGRIRMGPTQLVGPPVTASQWTHAATTWTPTMQTLFVGGTEVDSGAAPMQFDGSPVLLGVDRNNIEEYYLQGRLDDVRIYNRVLTADEIAVIAAR